ncbi:hypothetical protein JCM19236_3644 [Vibrio sp. JCM 19236]|nr:hypothetical protein JCM19236_3644 [Vibrio sp. JCM 19236]
MGSLALLPLLAFAAPKDGFYVAATLEPFNKTDVKIQQVGGVSGDNDFGYSLILGYDHLLNENITLGISGEYNNLGKATTYPVNWSASGFSITVRPKIYFGDSDIYISLM